MLSGATGQLRTVSGGMGGGGVMGVDMNALLALGQARGCDMDLLADVAPDFETIILRAHAENSKDTGVRGGEWPEDGETRA